jgi:hypothetical protein
MSEHYAVTKRDGWYYITFGEGSICAGPFWFKWNAQKVVDDLMQPRPAADVNADHAEKYANSIDHND